MMASYIDSAREALKLSRKGLSVADIKAKIGERYSEQVRHKIRAALQEERQNAARLSADEMVLILSVARTARLAVEAGDLCSPKLKYCGGMFWPRGKSERIARKRLGAHRKGEDPTNPGTGLGLLDPYHGGYVRLTRAGWALAYALETEKRSGSRSAT